MGRTWNANGARHEARLQELARTFFGPETTLEIEVEAPKPPKKSPAAAKKPLDMNEAPATGPGDLRGRVAFGHPGEGGTRVKNLSGMMKQAQKLQAKMMEMQAELGNRTVSAQAGGGMVEAVVNGRQELVSLRIDPEVVVAEDVEMLQDLILAAVNEALNRSREMMAAEMSKLTGGMQIPGLF